MKNIFRFRRHRNPPVSDVQQEQQSPFFSKTTAMPLTVQPKQTAFFQPKLTIGKADDPYEREADAVADKVVNKTNGQPPSVQNKEISSIQRLATPEEDKMPATNDARVAEDKRIQEKPMIQKMDAPKEEEKPAVQKMDAPKEEEKPAVQKMDAPKEEEKPAVQKMDAPKEEEKEAPSVQKAEKPEEEEPVQAKSKGGETTASAGFTAKVGQQQGQGHRLPDGTKARMESGFGRDFSGVTIHTDAESVALNRDIGAQAFTHGKDIYFDEGKFNPQNREGAHLLAHELTHVVQQKGDMIQRKPDLYRGGNASSPKIDNVRDSDIPVDKDGFVLPDTGGVSTFDKPKAEKNWWRFAKDFDAPDGIHIYNDHGNHYLWEPATRMLRTEFVKKLQTSIPQWVKIP